MEELTDNRLVRTFTDLRAAGRKTLLPFLTAGYPDLDVTLALLEDFERRGVRVMELGFPFSDPIADGPVIQASYTEALSKGVSADRVLETVRRYRDAGGQIALNAMLSYSIIYRHGVGGFLSAAGDAGFDGLIVPDLPLEEAKDFETAASDRGLCNVMLIAPTTPPPRREEIAAHSRGFLYYISVAGITGERASLPPETIDGVSALREHVDVPICVGFGISDPTTVRTVCEVADGAIVGSAIVHRITDGRGEPTEQLVADVGGFVGELLSPLV